MKSDGGDAVTPIKKTLEKIRKVKDYWVTPVTRNLAILSSVVEKKVTLGDASKIAASPTLSWLATQRRWRTTARPSASSQLTRRPT